jgi:uncharacterized protein YlxW (UPF0749 family)
MLAVLGFLVVLAASTDPPRREGAGSRREQLIDLIETRRGEIDSLDVDVAEMRENVTVAQQESAQSAGADDLDQIQQDAGLTPQSGRALKITLNDPQPELSADGRVAPFQIIDRDLQRLTNALWAAGAEAVAVGGERLVATSAIRNGGDTITVNFRPIVGPYEVIAIGADLASLQGSEIAREFGGWSERYGVQFSVEEVDDLEVPGYQGRARLRYASPVDTTSSAP